MRSPVYICRLHAGQLHDWNEVKDMKLVDTGIMAAKGFSVASVASGIKKAKLDTTLLVSDRDAQVAGAFTQNIVKAAPVVYDEAIVKKGKSVRALHVVSGNANACTGQQGMDDAVSTASYAAGKLGISSDEVLVCSTGVIGVPLPMDKVYSGLDACAASLSDEVSGAHESAKAICTTDTFAKEVAVEIEVGGNTVSIGGMAKGSGMIHPDMATMLSFITTDAAVDGDYLKTLLKGSIRDTYNMISVDGDTSTNDTVLVFANGASGCDLIDGDSPYKEVFEEAFLYVHTELAKLIVKDGEGAGKFIEVQVTGAPSKDDARTLARSVITSSLVKTAFFGSDANWGRVMCAMGYSGGNFSPEKVSMKYVSEAGEIEVMKDGNPIIFDEDIAKKVLEEAVITLKVTLDDGESEAHAWGCDLSYEYVRINGDYRS